MKDRLASKSASLGSNPDEPAPPRLSRPAPGDLIIGTARLKGLEDEIKALKSIEFQLSLPLTSLDEVDGRCRKLTEDQFDSLVKNLRNNQLVHPIVVRKKDDGRYEVISGHNRVQAYKDLGRTQIEARILSATSDEAEASALWANLLQPELPDFEKFTAFKRLMQVSNVNQTDLGRLAGISQSLVSRFMSFDKLPKEVLTLCSNLKTPLGASAAAALAKCTEAPCVRLLVVCC